jgi:NAD+ synthase (glutamine-hydrolysing)
MSLRIALAQLNLFVGDVGGNAQRVIDTAAEARDRLKADLVLFPELSLSGYPPEDLLFHKGMRRQVAAALERVRAERRRGARELSQAGAAELSGVR